MKLLSILLRLVAILGAAFCVYAWMDTKGKITDSMNDMAGIAGDTLKAKSVQVPAILKSKAKTEADLKKTEQSLKDTKSELETTEGELRDERDRMVQAQEEILDKNSQIRSLNSKVSSLESSVAQSDEEISALKDEIVKIKSETEPLIADLNAQITTLEESLSAKDIEMAEALAAAEEEHAAKLEESLKAAPVAKSASSSANAGEEAEEEKYVPEGELVSILKTNQDNNLFVVNKGIGAGLELDQRIKLYNRDTFVAEVTVILIQDGVAVCALYDKNSGIPESIFAGDIYEIKFPQEDTEDAEDTE